MDNGDSEGPAEGKTGLDFFAEVLREPVLIIDLEEMNSGTNKHHFSSLPYLQFEYVDFSQ